MFVFLYSLPPARLFAIVHIAYRRLQQFIKLWTKRIDASVCLQPRFTSPKALDDSGKLPKRLQVCSHLLYPAMPTRPVPALDSQSLLCL
jgi:hypothetical protein